MTPRGLIKQDSTCMLLCIRFATVIAYKVTFVVKFRIYMWKHVKRGLNANYKHYDHTLLN